MTDASNSKASDVVTPADMYRLMDQFPAAATIVTNAEMTPGSVYVMHPDMLRGLMPTLQIDQAPPMPIDKLIFRTRHTPLPTTDFRAVVLHCDPLGGPHAEPAAHRDIKYVWVLIAVLSVLLYSALALN